MQLKTFRIRALVDGHMRRSWGESVDEAAARKDAIKQLKKISKNFSIVSVEEITPELAAAEDVAAAVLKVDRINVPSDH